MLFLKKQNPKSSYVFEIIKLSLSEVDELKFEVEVFIPSEVLDKNYHDKFSIFIKYKDFYGKTISFEKLKENLKTKIEGRIIEIEKDIKAEEYALGLAKYLKIDYKGGI